MEEKKRKNYSRSEVQKATIEYFNGDQLAADVWINKYALKDSEGNIFELTPDDMHMRIAEELARVEQHYPDPLSEDEIFNLIRNFKYIIPQGSPMSGIGNRIQTVSLSNCYVIGNGSDSYGGIMMVDQEQVQLMKRRGGVGHDLSHLRPKNAQVNNSALTSTGVVPFMERYSNSTREVAQDGRRGALMLSINIKHPDAEDFIDAKLEMGKVTGANVSVKLTDEFMRCVIEEKPFVQQFPIDSENPLTKREINARALWNKIIHNAWKSAEPGLLFWDTILRESVPDCYSDFGFKTVTTNPCGEIPLSPYDSCRLLAINLYSYVNNPFTPEATFDYGLFKQHARYAQRFMDDIVDLEIEKIDDIIYKIKNDPEPQHVKNIELELWEKIKATTVLGRRTGLGITAEGDAVAAMGLRYGSDESIEFSTKIHKILATQSYIESIYLARTRGAFSCWNEDLEKENPFITRILQAIKEENPIYVDQYKKYGRRNIANLTVAPTGSVSVMTQTSSGIEPVFLPSYTRRRKINPNDKNVKSMFVDEVGDHWEEYNVFHPKFEIWARVNGYDVDDLRNMNSKNLQKIIELSPYHKSTSNDVDWVSKVRLQGSVQKWVDHSISVTVNLPSDITEEVVSKVYEEGWVSGCKGITVYRDGSRSGVLISDAEKKEIESLKENHAPKRPKRLKGEVHRFQNNLEKWVAVVGIKDGRPYEVFTGKNVNGLSTLPVSLSECEIVKNIIVDENGYRKKSYDIEYVDSDGNKQTHRGLNHAFDPEYWNYAKLISGILRHRMPLVYVHELIDSLNLRDDNLNTWKNGVARVIKRYIKDGEKGKGQCSSCGSEHLEYKEGCLTCVSCGSSKCS